MKNVPMTGEQLKTYEHVKRYDDVIAKSDNVTDTLGKIQTSVCSLLCKVADFEWENPDDIDIICDMCPLRYLGELKEWK